MTTIKRKRAVIDEELEYNDSNVWESLNTKSCVDFDCLDEWVSGSEVANYLMKDPVLDWLKYYYNKLGLNRDGFRNPMDVKNDYLEMLFKHGQDFEKLVNEAIIKKFNDKVEGFNGEEIDETIVVATNGRSDYTKEKYEETKKAILNGTPIILQGVLMSEKTKIRGIADIIIRSDYLNKLVKRPEMTKTYANKKADNLKQYHYVVIDIKWTGMTLCANGRSIRNDGRFKAYKGQLAMYNIILGEIQGYIPRFSYILAKSWKIDSTICPDEGWDCFDLLGTIDYADFDSDSIEKTVEGIEWLRKMRKHGHEWTPLDPKIKEMYPNSSNTNDEPWTKIKKQIVDEIHELTKIWYVTVEHRNKAIDKGITKWSDPKCTTDVLGISGARGEVIKEILKINQQKRVKVLPKKIKNKMKGWNKKTPVDFYVDFETITCCLYERETEIRDSECVPTIIFMIGVGWEEDKKWNYKTFVAEKYDQECEKKITNDFVNFVTLKGKQLDPDNYNFVKLYHWSNAEVTCFDSVNDRNGEMWNDWLMDKMWVDLYQLFTQEPIVVKGALTFKLKEIGKAMKSHDLITTVWDDSDLSDGLAAMNAAIKYYHKVEDDTRTFDDELMMDRIVKYNEIDCKIMWDIVRYLRLKHT